MSACSQGLFNCILPCRSVLFRQILPGLQSLLSCLRRIAEKKGKTMSQVRAYRVQNGLLNDSMIVPACHHY
jgi:pyridoxine 4-dehydrogenase